MIRFETLPAGVWPIKEYPSLGATLVECEHDQQFQRPTRGWIGVTPGGGSERVLPGGLNLTAAEARTLLHDGETLDYEGVLLCRICRADEIVTASFARNVKMLAVVPAAAAAQPALF